METRLTIPSDGLELAAILSMPDGLNADESCPVVVVLHGFGSNMEAGNVIKPCALLTSLGYATLRFDMRGCGASGGEKGRIICLDQVSDTRNVISFLSQHPSVDAKRVAVLGSSFGAAVAVYTAGIDERIAACVSASGWGHGERKFQGQHATPESYAKFLAMLDAGRRHREQTGESLMVSRYEIVPIPHGLRSHVVERSLQLFPHETAQSMFDFRAEDVVRQIAPRPLLLLHSAQDSVTPTEQSVAMFQKAGQPAELHLFADSDHFMFADENARIRRVLTDWLAEYFPVRSAPT